MKPVPQNSTHSQGARGPMWLRDPKSSSPDRDRPPLKDVTRPPPLHEDSADDEPGYGHGV